MKKNYWWLGPLLLGVGLGLPSLLDILPPMTDLADHLESVAILVNRNDPAFLPDLYVNNWGHPNQLFHFVGMCLGFVFGPLLAVKIVVFSTLALMILGAARILRRSGTSMMALATLAPLTSGFLYQWGLITNLVGLTCLVWALPALEPYARRPGILGIFKMIALLILLFFAHETSMIVFGGVSVLYALIFWGGWKKALVQSLPLPIAWGMHHWELYYHNVVVSIETGTKFQTAWAHVTGLIIYLWGYNTPGTERMLWVFMAAVVLSLVFPIRWKPWRRWPLWRKWIVRRRYLMVGFACFGLYAAMPTEVRGATLINMRFVSMAYLFCVVGLAPRALNVTAGRRVLWGAVPVAALLSTLPRHISVNKQLADVLVLKPLIQRGSSILMINADHGDDNGAFAFFDADSLMVSFLGGRSCSSFADSPIAPALIPPEKRWGPIFSRVIAFGGGFRPSYDFQFFRYVLLRTQDEGKAHVLAKLLEPEGKFLGHRGDWTLFESTLPMKPIDSPTPPDDSTAKTLFQRFTCIGYLATEPRWLRSDQSFKNIRECLPAVPLTRRAYIPGVDKQPLLFAP